MKVFAGILYFVSVLFLGSGFYKILFYVNDSYSTTNAYVGGDAYNYIINTNYAVAYFILAFMFASLATMVLILEELQTQRSHTKLDKIIELLKIQLSIPSTSEQSN